MGQGFGILGWAFLAWDSSVPPLSLLVKGQTGSNYVRLFLPCLPEHPPLNPNLPVCMLAAWRSQIYVSVPALPFFPSFTFYFS